MGLQNSPLLPDLHYTNTSFSVTPCWLGTESQGPDLMDLFSSCWSCHEFSPSPSVCHLAFYISQSTCLYLSRHPVQFSLPGNSPYSGSSRGHFKMLWHIECKRPFPHQKMGPGNLWSGLPLSSHAWARLFPRISHYLVQLAAQC